MIWRVSLRTHAAAIAALVLASSLAVAQAPVIGQGGAAPGPPLVYRNTHAYAGGGQPKIDPAAGNVTACGPTSIVRGTDTAGFVQFNAGTPTAYCQINFAVQWAAGTSSICMFQGDSTSSATLFTATSDNVSIYIKNWVNGSAVNWFCVGTPSPLGGSRSLELTGRPGPEFKAEPF